jgi:hypothetical protein
MPAAAIGAMIRFQPQIVGCKDDFLLAGDGVGLDARFIAIFAAGFAGRRGCKRFNFSHILILTRKSLA